MELSDLLSPEAIAPSLRSSSKKHLLQELANRAGEIYGVDSRRVFEALLERERLGPTGMGRGVAIPHARLPELTEIYGLFARLEENIDFDAMDDEPVDLVFMILAPEEAGAAHLKALARVSRTLRDPAVCAKLRTSNDESSIYAILTEAAPSRAA